MVSMSGVGRAMKKNKAGEGWGEAGPGWEGSTGKGWGQIWKKTAGPLRSGLYHSRGEGTGED